MTQPQDQQSTSPAPAPVPPTSRLQPPPQRSCMSRIGGFIGWIFTLALSVALGLAALAAILYFYFGFTLNTPAEIRQANTDIDTLQSQNQALQTEVALFSTASAEQLSSGSTARERIDDLEARLLSYEEQAAELADQASTAAALAGELNENIAAAATMQAEARENQVLVSVFATVQADNTIRLGDLQRRTDQIARFLQRLGDLAADASLDTGPTTNSVPTVTPPAPEESTPPAITPPSGTGVEPTPTATPAP